MRAASAWVKFDAVGMVGIGDDAGTGEGDEGGITANGDAAKFCWLWYSGMLCLLLLGGIYVVLSTLKF